MIFTIDQYLTLAETINKELAPLEKKKQINLVKSQWGGHGFVNKVFAIANWWKDLSQEWQDKISDLPFKVIKQDGWVTLTQLSEEKLGEWFEGITAKFEKQGRLLASDLKRVATPLLPEKPKSTLKLGEEVTDDEFEVVGRKYRFEEDDLETFKNTVLSNHEKNSDAPLLTEHLFYYLELADCDPLRILAKAEKTTWLLLQKDQEIEAERSQRLKLEQGLKQELQKCLDQQAEVFKQQLREQKEFYEGQMSQLLARITKLEQKMQNRGKSHKKRDFLSEVAQVSHSASESLSSQKQKKRGFAELTKT